MSKIYDLFAWETWVHSSQAITDLRATEDGSPFSDLWKLRYHSAVAILRGIGHALRNRDRCQDSELQRRIDTRWEAIRSHPLFQWLESQRNMALKEYNFDARMFRGHEWSGPALWPEEAADAKDVGMLFIGEEPAVDRLWQVWHMWGDILGAIRFDKKGTFEGAGW